MTSIDDDLGINSAADAVTVVYTEVSDSVAFSQINDLVKSKKVIIFCSHILSVFSKIINCIM